MTAASSWAAWLTISMVSGSETAISLVYRLITSLTTSDLGSESNPTVASYTNGLWSALDVARYSSNAAIKSGTRPSAAMPASLADARQMKGLAKESRYTARM